MKPLLLYLWQTNDRQMSKGFSSPLEECRNEGKPSPAGKRNQRKFRRLEGFDLNAEFSSFAFEIEG
jgi:hypothetical protein